MPLHLKQKLRQALRKNEHPSADSLTGNEQLDRENALREHENVEVNGTNFAPHDGDALAEGPLTTGFDRLRLDEIPSGELFPKELDGKAERSDSADINGTSAFHTRTAADVVDLEHRRQNESRSAWASESNSSPPKPADNDFIPSRYRTNTEDVSVETTHLPAVTQETRVVNTHEIIEQRITRDIHNYDIIHRVLPVIDIEVLPPRHFVHSPSGDSLIEIPASQVPGGGSDDAAIQRAIKEAFLKEALKPQSTGVS